MKQTKNSTKNYGKVWNYGKVLTVIGLTVIVFVAIIAVAWSKESFYSPAKADHTLKYWPVVVNKWNPQDSARTMKRILDMMSWQMVNGSVQDWDLMWSIEYPYVMFENEMKNLKPHQRVNHFPGVNAIAVKRTMATNNRFSFIPPAFKFPDMIEEFKNYVKTNPDSKFVEKLKNNRGVKIVSVDEIEFENTEKFVQRFIENPLLIDGHAFDIGIYVLISSINPLRIYRYRGEMLVRLCSEPFHPFDPKNLDKYVVSDEFKMFFTTPSFEKLYAELGYSCKDIFENHLRQRGFNVTDLWRQVDEAIVTLITKNEEGFLSKTLQYNDPSHFFELMRFDFIINDNFQVFLMEAQMSPNLTPDAPKYEQHALQYEQSVYNALRLIGAEDYHNYMYRVADKTSTYRVITNFRHIAIDIEVCARAACSADCDSPMCSHCLSCISGSNFRHTYEAYQEHIRRGDMMRIFPSRSHYNDEVIERMSPSNKFSAKWFKKMCAKHEDFC